MQPSRPQPYQQYIESATPSQPANINGPFGYSTQHSDSSIGDADEMNPYQQYSANYGQQQQPQQQPPQHQPQQQQPPPPQQPQQHTQRPYMQNQLPPLAAGMGPTSMAIPSHPPYIAAPPASMTQTPQQLGTPPTRPGASNPPQERKMSSSSTRDGLRYTLDVVQQPQRARMCGFGDKDRRPITPPPCVRLIITSVETNREILMSDIQSDPSFFVLQVDLWAENADREANVVRASSNSPAVSISSATTTSYPPPNEHPRMTNEGQPLVYLGGQDGHPMYATVPGYAMPLARPMAQPQFGPGLYYQHVPPTQTMQHFMPQTQSSSAMYTRNLIGSLTVNASQLKDNEGKSGYWFVLQDLSVRTEGFFRLRMSFIDISAHGAPGVNRGKAPVLAWTFSDIFQVYSAKKFPGVIESTPLSKTFASQGIKIPIRKDNKNEQQDDDDGD